MIATLLALAAPAWADPVALRAPQARVVGSVGLPDTSVGVWLTPGFGVSAEYHPYSAVGASVGWRADVARTDGGFGLEVGAAGGPMYAWLDPGLVLAATPMAQVGWKTEGLTATLGAAVPAALHVAPGFQARLPVLGELWLGGRIGAFALGGHLGAGSTFVPGAPTELGWEAGLDVGFGRVGGAR